MEEKDTNILYGYSNVQIRVFVDIMIDTVL